MRDRPVPSRLGPRWALLLTAFLALAAGAGGGRAEDPEPPDGPGAAEAPVPSAVRADPLGEVTRRAAAVGRALLTGDAEGAFTELVSLCEEHGDALLPAASWRRARARDAGLLLPVRELAAEALVGLGEPFAARLAARWGPAAEALERVAARGAPAALVRLAEEYSALPAGRRAWLLRADLAEERGQDLEAARALEAWLRLESSAAPRARAAVAVRLAEALVRLGDAGGPAALVEDQAALADVPVARAGRVRTLAGVVAAAREGGAARAPPAGPPPFADGEELRGVWSLDLADRRALTSDGSGEGWNTLVSAALAVRGDRVFVHAGRRVRAVDLPTGAVLWTFPKEPPPALHAALERYQETDLPHRVVVAAGDVVLTVLGDPVATAEYPYQGEEWGAQQQGQECRTRLVALDAATGALRWCTGTAQETHPVLGRMDCGCISPPLVVGDRVFALFACLAGGAEVYLATLDLATGAPRAVTWLAAGTGGRSPDRALLPRHAPSPFVQALPWGAPPVLAGDELCVQPHAGFVAGVGLADGRVRWVRALSRYPHQDTPGADMGARVSNAPRAHGDAWIVAPMDCPEVLCLARHSGAERWRARLPEAAGCPWQLVGVRPDAAGRAVVALVGAQVLELDAADGSVRRWVRDPWGEEQSIYGRVAEVGGWWVGSDGWRLLALGPGASAGPLTAGEPEDPAPRLRLDLADVVSADPWWLVLDEDRLVALLPERSLAESLAGGGTDDPARGLLRRAVRAGARGEASGLVGAIEEAAALAPGAPRTALLARLGAELLRQVPEEGLPGWLAAPAPRARLRAVLPALPAGVRAALRHRLVGCLRAGGAEGAAAQVLGDWLADAEPAWVETGRGPDGAQRVVAGAVGREPLPGAGDSEVLRSDLLAQRWLRAGLEGAAGLALAQDLDARAAAALEPAGDAPEALAALVRAWPGTRAAATARERLMRRRAAGGDFAGAADLAADLRLDPPLLDAGGPREARLTRAAQLQLHEASWRLRSHDALRARTLLADLLRWAPGGLTDDQGATRDVLDEQAARRLGWHPRFGHEAPRVPFPAEDAAPGATPSGAALRALEILGLEGPGAEHWQDRVLLVRGITPELWEVDRRGRSRRLARLPGADEGWFGGSLRAVDPWVPGAGILVGDLVAREPADASGLMGGDWIVSWDGAPVPDLGAFMQRVAATPPGQEVPAEVRRRGRPVLDRFRAGRRPATQGGALGYGALWVAADGRALLPGRTTLSWVDPRTLERTRLWEWREPGVVEGLEVVGDVAVALVRRRLVADLLVAVPLAGGPERWRAAIEGDVDRIQPVGSGLWVTTWDPSAGWLLDAADGGVRAIVPCAEHLRDEFRRSYAPAHASDVAAGRVYATSTARDATRAVRVLNSTRGTEEWRDAGQAPWSDLNQNDMVAAGPATALLRRGALYLVTVDPLGEGGQALAVPGALLREDDGAYGWLDDDTRLYVRGWTLFVVRVPGRGVVNVNAASWSIDPFVLAALARGGDAGTLPPPVALRGAQALLPGSRSRYRTLLAAQPHFEGLFVLAALLGPDPRMDTRWVSAGLRRDHVDGRLFEGPVREARRHLPVRVGSRLLVPSDEGALLLAAPHD